MNVIRENTLEVTVEPESTRYAYSSILHYFLEIAFPIKTNTNGIRMSYNFIKIR